MKFQITKKEIKYFLSCQEEIKLFSKKADSKEFNVLLEAIAELVWCDIELTRDTNVDGDMDVYINDEFKGSVLQENGGYIFREE